MVNPSVTSALVGSGMTVFTGFLGAVIRLIMKGFGDLKIHLTKQDENFQALSNRVSKIEGQLEGNSVGANAGTPNA